MRQEPNNEMDLLLRRLSRRQGLPASDENSLNDADHLDADELSSYAENALPTAARARYTEHLAECSRCRELVVQLSGSVPVVAARETVVAAGPSGLKKFLASFFSPMVLRYAVPALGLIVVAAIGFAVFRSNRPLESIAKLNDSTASPPTQSPAEQPAAFNDSQTRNASPTSQASPGDVAARKSVAQTEEAKQTAPPNAQSETADRAEPKRNEPAASAERQPVANAAPVTVTAAPAATIDEVRVDVEGRSAKEPPRAPTGDLAKLKAGEDNREQEKKAEGSTARRAARDQAIAPQSAGTGSAYMVDGKEKDSKDDGVVRSAGGRRFRKQNGVWVDTAYDSGSQIVNVARGSEQYRALVADEPTIKSIADELAGTIIVVWKGRTYRIR